MKNTISSHDYYFEFYEELGRQYSETDLVHAYRGRASRYATVLQELRPYATRGDKLLDVGCNDGVYAIPYSENGGRAVGIDISPSLIRRASGKAAHLGLSNCRFVQADIESPKIEQTIGENFDVVLCSEVLEHLTSPDQALRKMRELLREGGSLILSTPTGLTACMQTTCPRGVLRLFRELLHKGMKCASTTLTGKKLLEPLIIDTTKIPALRSRRISAYLYRHDGYYPRALCKYVQSIGFRCVRFYTIDFLSRTVFLERMLAQLRRGLAPTSGASTFCELDAPFSFVDEAWQPGYEAAELAMRRIPLINLLGSTNVGVFRRL
jgi:2-polyprenyl-3-methyl-5-hydroxy-6-metoxy-1,4-benzoquinol methylase